MKLSQPTSDPGPTAMGIIDTAASGSALPDTDSGQDANQYDTRGASEQGRQRESDNKYSWSDGMTLPMPLERGTDVVRLWYRTWEPFANLLDEIEPAYDRRDIRLWYRRFAGHVARIYAHTSAAYHRIITIGFIVTLAACVFTPLLLWNARAWLILNALTFLAVVLAGISDFIGLRLLKSLRLRLAIPAAIFTFTATLGYLLLPPSALQDRERAAAVVADFGNLPAVTLTVVSATCLFVSLLNIIGTLYFARLARKAWLESPGAAAVDELVDLLDDLNDEHPFMYYPDRARMIKRLHDAGMFVRALPKVIQLPDSTQRSIFIDRCESAAASLESLEIWVALPKEDTARELSKIVARTVFVLITGRYDDLPQLELSAASPAQKLRSAAEVFKTLLVGTFPIIALIIAKAAGVQIDGALGSDVAVFSILWASVTYLSVLDPDLTKRLSVIRDIVTTLKASSELR